MDEMPHSTAPLDGGEIGHVMRKKNTQLLPEANIVLTRTFASFRYSGRKRYVLFRKTEYMRCQNILIDVDALKIRTYEMAYLSMRLVMVR
jgi:hypothetical protein